MSVPAGRPPVFFRSAMSLFICVRVIFVVWHLPVAFAGWLRRSEEFGAERVVVGYAPRTMRVPSAMTQAPVSVAASTIFVAPSLFA